MRKLQGENIFNPKLGPWGESFCLHTSGHHRIETCSTSGLQTRPTCPNHSGFFGWEIAANTIIRRMKRRENKNNLFFFCFPLSICDTDIHNHGPVHTWSSGSSDVVRYVTDSVTRCCTSWEFGWRITLWFLHDATISVVRNLSHH